MKPVTLLKTNDMRKCRMKYLLLLIVMLPVSVIAADVEQAKGFFKAIAESDDAIFYVLMLIFGVSCAGVHALFRLTTMFHDFRVQFIASQAEIMQKLQFGHERMDDIEDDLKRHETTLQDHALKLERHASYIKFHEKGEV